MQDDKYILREIQLTQLEILRYVVNICEKNDLNYSLYAGTLLGAVRHKGFIPWDDDLDICMPREDYNKFIKIWEIENRGNYILQNKDNTPSFTQAFTKVRKYNTNYLTEYDLGKEYHTGIFIDIFPIDLISNGNIPRMIFWLKTMIYHLLIREFAPNENGRTVKIISKLILFFIPKKIRPILRKKLLESIVKHNTKKNSNIVFIETIQTMRQIYDTSLIDEYTCLEFEGEKFNCFSKWDYYLKTKYGEYMELPDEKDRMWKHKPLKIDLTNCPAGYER